ncbi:TVP38/TMEM64 family protein [Weissella halotolerans]|nr:VTT domain-containing protein [Weissella halotolerans]
MQTKYTKWLIQSISYLGLIFTGWLVYDLYSKGIFTDGDALIRLVKGYGVWAPTIFVIIQIVQVVIPIIPGGITLPAGAYIFGPLWGFVYNYLGIVIGSLILFGLGRRYGRRIVDAFVSEKTINKYIRRLDGKGWRTTFALLILMPLAPDDALVLLTSLSDMSWREFTWIIILCKPATVFAYSMAVMYGADWVMRMLS